MGNWISERVGTFERAQQRLRKTVEQDIEVANRLDPALSYSRFLTLSDEWDRTRFPDFIGFIVTASSSNEQLYATFGFQVVELELMVIGPRIPEGGRVFSIMEDEGRNTYFYSNDENKTYTPEKLSEYALTPLIFRS